MSRVPALRTKFAPVLRGEVFSHDPTMHLAPPLFGLVPPSPSPVWFVSNGETTVGPVATNLLKRGVAYGKIPDSCVVSPPAGTWRGLERVREIAALWKRRGVSAGPAVPAGIAGVESLAPARIRDQDEVCYQVTRLAMMVTGAESGMFHFRERRSRSRSLTTRCVLGPMSIARLYEPLLPMDPLLRSAQMGAPIFGTPEGPAEQALAMRFATTQGGVGGAAMIPIFVGSSLRAMLELSRPVRAFRRDDLQRAERIAQRALYQHES